MSRLLALFALGQLVASCSGDAWAGPIPNALVGGGGVLATDIDTSAELKAILTDETGSGGGVVFATGPTISNPVFTTSLTGTNVLGFNAIATNDPMIWDSGFTTISTLRQGKRTFTNSTAGSPLTYQQSGTQITNEGASARLDLTLPAAPTGAVQYCYEFRVQDSDGLKIIAGTGDTIRNAGSVSATAGYICDAATIGNALTLCSINATEWFVASVIGTWTIDSGC